MRGAAGCSIAVGRSDKLACYYTQTENIQAFRVESRKQMHCANAYRVGSNNSSFLTKSAHAHLAFLAGTISSVDTRRLPSPWKATLYLENGGSMLLQSASIPLPKCVTSHSRRPG